MAVHPHPKRRSVVCGVVCGADGGWEKVRRERERVCVCGVLRRVNGEVSSSQPGSGTDSVVHMLQKKCAAVHICRQSLYLVRLPLAGPLILLQSPVARTGVSRNMQRTYV